jgi:predicted nuclease of restriction endonuclease-like RecB superfamily
MRLRVFSLAAAMHPLVTEPDQIFERSEREVKQRIAAEIGQPWEQIDAALYADVIDLQRLTKFESFPTAAALLSRYNVAQVQACLYKAEQLEVEARGDFKTILRYAKLARLLHEIRRIDRPADHAAAPVYNIRLTGPVSVLKETRRYGIAFARFVAALLTCKDWKLLAVVHGPFHKRGRLVLSSDDGLCSHLAAPPDFDSDLEEQFAKDFGDERDGWRLIREGVILHEGQTAYVPDFLLRREQDGRVEEVLLEIAGFWAPSYWEAKRQTLRTFAKHRVLVAIPRRAVKRGVAPPGDVILFGKSLKPKQVLESLRARI